MVTANRDRAANKVIGITGINRSSPAVAKMIFLRVLCVLRG
jgi:hypothetical protein